MGLVLAPVSSPCCGGRLNPTTAAAALLGRCEEETTADQRRRGRRVASAASPRLVPGDTRWNSCFLVEKKGYLEKGGQLHGGREALMGNGVQGRCWSSICPSALGWGELIPPLAPMDTQPPSRWLRRCPR